MLHKVAVFILSFFLVFNSFGQQNDSTLTDIQELPNTYYSKVDQKLTSINDRLTKKSIKFLERFQRHENKLRKKLAKLNGDSTNVLANAEEEYNQLIGKIKTKTAKVAGEKGGYNAYLDTLSTSLSFLKQFKNTSRSVAKPLASLTNLQSKFQQSEKIKEFITQRKQQMKEFLSKYTKIPAGLTKEYVKLNKSAHYYSAQVKEYKEMLKDPSKVEQKALNLLNKLPAFQKFMKKNSQLASMFRMPDNYGSATGLAGLQTRSSIQALIQQRVGAGGPNAQQIMQQNIAQAKSALDKLKDKIAKLGGGSSDLEMPDFKPNDQKTKSFFNRLEYGANVQFAKSSNLFPSTANIGLSLGYKINEKSIVGIGIGYKMGMGTIRRIVISHQGIGLRSFIDYKIKKSLYLSGGFEMNYNTQFKKVEQLKKFNDWQSSGLVGVSKKYKVSSKVKGEMKLLYDFLANSHRPVTQPIVYRLGYKF